jgi:uncharacterized phage infection (PIP) family protein YhgE
VATLDDAAEALVLKLRGLDDEIAHSEHELQEYRTRIEAVTHEVDQEWTALGETVSTFMAKLHEQQDKLGQESQQALHAAADTQQALADGASEAHAELADGRQQLEALAHHAAGLQPNLESLAREAGEAPAHALAQQAAQIEHELEQALDEARDFLATDVVHGLEQLAQDIRERCQQLRTTLADQAAHALQAAYDEWQSKVEELEQYVSTRAFDASRQHAHDVVDYALEECQTAFTQQAEQTHQAVEALVGQLQALAAEAQRSAEAVVAQAGKEVAGELDGTHEAATTALSALGSVRDLLARYRFVRV